MSHERRIVLFIAMSLDGYIATKEDDLEWLFKVSGEGDNGYSEFYDTVDTIIMGRRTYDWLMDYEKDNFPYKDKICYVFSKTMTGKNDNVEFINQDVTEFSNKLKQIKGQKIWLVGGSRLLHYFIKERLVEEFIITIAPVLIGDGIPLFEKTFSEMPLVLKDTCRFNQFVQLRYELK